MLMVSDNYPFGGNNHALVKEILNSEPQSPGAFSAEFIDLVSQMLQKNPENRISLSNIKQHAWFHDFEYQLLLKTELNRNFYDYSNIDRNIV
jgi:serine/threonine protein kinase